MAFQFPGGANTFVPMAQQALQVNFSQNPSSFLLNKYVSIISIDKPGGYYIYHSPDEETRIDYSNAADMVWNDGSYPQVNFSKGQQFVQFLTQRYHQMFTIGDIAQESAAGLWDVIADHAASAASRLMTLRTYNVLGQLTNTDNWGTSTATATSIGGGYWSAGGDSNPPYIQKSLQSAIVDIQKATNSTVGPKDLVLVIDPDTAFAMSQSPEIRNYLKSSYVAGQFLEGSGFLYGLPDPLYGIRVVVEDRVSSATAHGQASANTYILGKNALLLSRPGALMGGSLYNSMSTASLAVFEDLSVQVEHKQLAR